MGMDLISYKASKKIAASALAGVSSMTVDGQTLNIVTKDGTTLPMTFPTPKDGDKGEPGKDGKDGKSPYDIAVDNGFVGTETEWLESLKATDGKDGVTPNLTIGTVETLAAGSNATATITGDKENPVLNLGIPKGADGKGGSSGSENFIEANPSIDGNEEVLNSININGINYSIIDPDEKHYKYTYHDVRIIPDKHNTGVDNNIQLEAETLYIDLNSKEYKNKTGVIVYENKDFSSDDAQIPNGWGYVGEGLKIVFNNCKFRKYRQSYDAEKVEIEFNNCTFMMMATAYRSTFNKCFFGKFDNDVDGDACNPKSNCILNDCYIANVVVKTDAQRDDHIDGTQILNGDNVEFNNCRWECPDVHYTYTQGGVSYAVYIQDSTNCRLNNCHINGGGNYSISCTKEGNSIKNSFIGQSFINKPFYPTHQTDIENIDLFNSLYVSSVWKDENNYLHFLVTNDTKIDREIAVLTNIGVTKFSIPRTYTRDEYDVDTKNFEDFPIDIEKVIEEDVDYVVFFENGRQIRFVNFTDFAVVRNNLDILDISARYDDTEIRGEISDLKIYIDNQIGGVLDGSY